MTLLIDIRGSMSLDGKFPALRVGDAYYGRVTASGGTPFYTYAIVKGVLPAGLTLDTITGEVTGTPTSNKMVAITIKAMDLQGMSVERVFVIPGATVIEIGSGKNDVWPYKSVPANRFDANAGFWVYDDIPWRFAQAPFGSGVHLKPTGDANTSVPYGYEISVMVRGSVRKGQTIIVGSDDGNRIWIDDLLVSNWKSSTQMTAPRSGVLTVQATDSYPSGSPTIYLSVAVS